MSELTKALIQFHKDVDKIDKNARANYGKFADLANVLSTVTPALLKNDLVVTQTFIEDSLATQLRHTSGEQITSCCKLIPCDGRNVTQEWGKAVTFQRRYSIVSLLGLVADMDVDDIPEEDLPASKRSTAKPAAKASSKPATSAAFNAGAKVIQAAKDLAALQTLSKRVAERNEKKDFKPGEYEQLVELLRNREAQIKEHQK